MEMLIFIYNILLLILFCVSTTFAVTSYLKSKQKLFLIIGIMFVFNIFDNTVIYMTEAIEWFGRLYDNQFMSIPSFKTVILVVDAICITLIFNHILRRKILMTQYVSLILLGLLLLFIPMMNAEALQVWLYYLPNQLYLFGLGVSTLWYLNKSSEIRKDEKKYKVFKRMLQIVIIFSVLILLEDTIVIFNLDIYSDMLVRINNRNISEDVLSIIYACYTVSICYNLLEVEPQSVDTLLELEQEQEIPKEVDLYGEFCAKYDLTLREQEILRCLLQNMNNKDISSTLFISVGTVKTHIHNIFTKMEVAKRTEAFALFQKWKEQM